MNVLDTGQNATKDMLTIEVIRIAIKALTIIIILKCGSQSRINFEQKLQIDKNGYIGYSFYGPAFYL